MGGCTVVDWSRTVRVDVLIAVYNAEETIVETVESALAQTTPSPSQLAIDIHICCYNDGSTDESWKLLQDLKRRHNEKQGTGLGKVKTRLWIGCEE